MPKEEEYDEDSEETRCRAGQIRPHPLQRRGTCMKKPVTLDLNGLSWGSMKECLADDIKNYAKNLDPTCNWESQPSPQREQLFRRLYKGMTTDVLYFSSSIGFWFPVVMAHRNTFMKERISTCMSCKEEYVNRLGVYIYTEVCLCLVSQFLEVSV